MRKLIVNEFTSLDGVAQAPGAADEDPSGGFAHGGCHMQYMEDVVEGQVTGVGAILATNARGRVKGVRWPS